MKRKICALILGLLLICSTEAFSLSDRKYKIRGKFDYGPIGGGSTIIVSERGRSLYLPNMSSAAIYLRERCERYQNYEVIYSFDANRMVKIHSVTKLNN